MRLSVTYGKESGLVMSPGELSETFLFGIDLVDRKGRRMSNGAITEIIRFAQSEVESHLSLKLCLQIYEESLTYYRNEFMSWGFIPTAYPVVKAYELEGWYNSTKQIEYPKQWLSTKKSAEQLYERRIHIVPDNTLTSPLIQHNIVPFYGLYRSDFLPDYWRVRYATGFTSVPKDLVSIVGKIAAINVLRMMGDVILGVGFQSMSLGIDGLSQSISKPSGSVFDARIKGYMEEFKELWGVVSGKYKGLLMISC